MSGMQDVAALATRYQELESTAQKLRNTIDKMQREASESYESVRTRTVELERIHETSSLLKQLKQFNHAKAQIDHYTKDAKDLTAQGSQSRTTNITILQVIFDNTPPWQKLFKNLRRYFDPLPFRLSVS